VARRTELRRDSLLRRLAPAGRRSDEQGRPGSLGAFTSTAAAGGGNSANAESCQKNGWQSLTRQDGTSFANQGDCVSHGAQGGALVAKSSGGGLGF